VISQLLHMDAVLHARPNCTFNVAPTKKLQHWYCGKRKWIA